MKTITDKFLNNWCACEDGVEWLNNQNTRKVDEVIHLLIKEERFNWAIWLIARALPTKKKRVQFAIFSAEQCIKTYETKYPDDKRPRQAIQAAQNWVKNPTEKNKRAARSAESAARSAESAVWSALWSAESAAITGEYTKILQHGLELLNSK